MHFLRIFAFFVYFSGPLCAIAVFKFMDAVDLVVGGIWLNFEHNFNGAPGGGDTVPYLGLT